MGYKLNMLRDNPHDTGIPITVWSGAAFANQTGSRSTMGQIFTTPYGLLSWRSKTIPGVPLSSTDTDTHTHRHTHAVLHLERMQLTSTHVYAEALRAPASGVIALNAAISSEEIILRNT